MDHKSLFLILHEHVISVVVIVIIDVLNTQHLATQMKNANYSLVLKVQCCVLPGKHWLN